MSTTSKNWSLYLALAALLASFQLAAGFFTSRGAVEAGLPALVTVATVWFLGAGLAAAAAVAVIVAADREKEILTPHPSKLQLPRRSVSYKKPLAKTMAIVARPLLDASAGILVLGLGALLIDRFVNGVG